MKRIVPILLLLIVVAFGAAAMAPKLAPESRLRAEAQAALELATGQPATLDGAVTFSAFPRPAIVMAHVAFGEPGSATLDIPSARVILDLMPLFAGRVRAARIELDSPRIVLAGSMGDSLEPWNALAATLGREAPSAHLQVHNGTVLLTHDGINDIVLRELSGDLRWRGGRSLEAEGEVIWRGQTMAFDLDIADLASLARGRAASASLSISGAPVALTYKGSGRLAGGGIYADGDLTIASPRLRDAMSWLGTDAPTEEGFGAFSLRARALASGTSVALSNARLDLDGNRGDGGMTVRIEKGRPIVQGSFAADSFDLSPYGRIAMSEPDSEEWNASPIDVGRLREFDLDLRLSAGRVIAGESRFTRVAASALLKGGRLSLAIGEAEGWNGSLRASANLTPRAGRRGGEVRAEIVGTDVDLAAALASVVRQQHIQGVGSFRILAGGGGASVAEIVTNLEGALTLDASNGALVGIDVGRVLTRLERRPLSGGSSLRGGNTDFDQLNAKATIHRGTVQLDRLTAESSVVKIAVGGEISIADRTLDLNGTAALVRPAQADEPPFDLPFVVQGSWDSPYLLPDAQAMIRRSDAARPLLEPSRLGIVSPAP